MVGVLKIPSLLNMIKLVVENTYLGHEERNDTSYIAEQPPVI